MERQWPLFRDPELMAGSKGELSRVRVNGDLELPEDLWDRDRFNNEVSHVLGLPCAKHYA